jgi:hypothetical protein
MVDHPSNDDWIDASQHCKTKKNNLHRICHMPIKLMFAIKFNWRKNNIKDKNLDEHKRRILYLTDSITPPKGYLQNIVGWVVFEVITINLVLQGLIWINKYDI